MYSCTLFLFNTLLTYFLIFDQTCFFVHKYISLIHLDVMDNFCDEQRNMECNIREIKNRKCNRITMLRASSCPSRVWMQASPLNFTNVAACTEELALSLSRAPHTPYIYLYEPNQNSIELNSSQQYILSEHHSLRSRRGLARAGMT